MSRQAADLAPGTQLEPRDLSYIKVRRSMLRHLHPFHPMAMGEKACRGFAWFDLVAMAAYEDGSEFLRGQFSVSQTYLEGRWNWSITRVRNFLDYLESNGLIDRKRTGGKKPTVISICNYDYYNGNDRANKLDEKKVELPPRCRSIETKCTEETTGFSEEVSVLKSNSVLEQPLIKLDKSELPNEETRRESSNLVCDAVERLDTGSVQ